MPIGGYNWTLPLLQQINRQGDIMMYADQARRANEQNAMQKKIFNLDYASKVNALAEKEGLKQALIGVGDVSGLEEAAKRLIASGRPEGLELFMKAQDIKSKGAYSLKPGEIRYDSSGNKVAGNETSQLTGDAKNLEVILGRKPTLQEIESFKRAGAQTINMPKITMGRESELGSQGIKDIKDARKDVMMARSAVNRIDQALDILDKHGDDVAGWGGMFRRWLAPIAKPIGMDVNKATDAEILQSLLTAGAGSLRSEVVGPGPVTNFEQNILQQVSGGKMSYADGIAAILEEARKNHISKIEQHNEQILAVSGIEGFEKAQNIFKPIPYTSRPPRKTKEIKTETPDYTKMSNAELLEVIQKGVK